LSEVEGTLSIDIVTALEAAANTIHDVTLMERRRLIECGMDAAVTERSHLSSNGNIAPVEPAFMADMPTLAAAACRSDTVTVIVSAGMLLLAAEIGRLRRLNVDRG
jgi:hypothetical protein